MGTNRKEKPRGVKQTLPEAQESRMSLLASIVDSSDDAIISKTPDGVITSWNRAAERIFGYRAEEIIGQPISLLLPPGRADEMDQILEQIRRGERVEHLETTRRRRDGSCIEVSLTVSPIYDSAGRLIGASSIKRDITETKRMEAEIQRVASFPLMNPDPVLEVDAEGNLTFCNPAAKQVLEEAGGNGSLNPFVPQDLQTILQDLLNSKASGFYREVEINDKIYEELISPTPQYNAFRFYTRDITRRKHAEQEREHLLLQLQSVLESINEGVVISTLEGDILAMNKEALALHEYESLEQVRRHLSDFTRTFDLFDLQGRPLQLEEWPLARVLRGERFTDYDVRLRRKDTGSVRIASYSGTPVQNKAGEAILAVITLRDITERKEMEETLRVAKAQLQVITDTMPAGVARCSRDRRYLWVSPEYARWLGRLPEEIAGHPMAEVIGKEAYETVSPYIDLVLTGQRVSYEAGVNYVGLGTRWITATYTPTYDSEGLADGWVAVVFDITHRKELEEQIKHLNDTLAARVSELEEMNQELAAFNHMVSHDLRQPLNTIGTSCQAINILCGDSLGEKCQEYVKIAYNSVFLMNDLIGALLNFSRSTHSELRLETVNLSDMARSVAAELRLTDPNRRVRFDIAEGLVARGDPSLLRLVFENLIGNAWKYTGTRQEAVIEFGASESAGEKAYFVRDNGKGFDMADADRLFAPFRRLRGSEPFRGFGIGLATVERIIRRHGGRVWAEGEPDKGATFYFTQPADGSSN